jgi:hypothetical protein
MKTSLFTVLLALLLPCAAAAEDLLPDRRKPQFTYEPGYYLVPLPYSIPGAGDGAGVLGIANNLNGTAADLFAFGLAGDLPGFGIGVSDLHLVPRTLILDLTTIQFGHSSITNFKERGMETGKHDFTYLQFDNYGFVGGRLTASFLDRRLEAYGGGYYIFSELTGIKDEQGNTIIDVEGSPRWRTNVYGLGLRGDITDDYYDPRRGLRLDVGRWWSPPASDNNPEFYRMEYSATVYFPLGKRSTWVFNAFRSDARVTRQGETNPAAVEQQQGLNCSDPGLTAQQQLECRQVVDTIVAGNTYGTATGLGGTSRLRAYPNDRYSGAHTLFYGTEIRWTLTEEAYPFDIFIAKDVRTLLQVAAFYELGTVADLRDELGDLYRPSYGAGFRMVTASGIVFRADLAFGREGMETTVILGYPWESF